MTLFPQAAQAIKLHPVGAKLSAITSKEDLAKIVAKLRAEGKTIVWTNGVFDLMHVGHIMLLQHAAEQGDALIVGMNSDASIKKHKPIKNGVARPLINQDLRVASILSLKNICAVVVFDEQTPADCLHIIKPDVWVRGAIFDKENGMPMEEHPEGKIVTSYGGKCVTLPMIGEFSTTDVITRVMNLRPEKL